MDISTAAFGENAEFGFTTLKNSKPLPISPELAR